MSGDVVVDFGAALNRHVQEQGLMPTDGAMVEVDYVMTVRMRVLYPDGTASTEYKSLWSSRVEPCAHEGMASRALREAQTRNAA